jgi:hypothetical protein
MTELLYDCTAGVHATKHPSLVGSILCASICTPIGILCHRFHTYDVLMRCVRCAAARNLCEFIFDIAVTPMEVTTHPSTSPSCISYLICVFICSVHTRPAVLRGEGWGSYHTVLLLRDQIQYILSINIPPRNSVLHAL